MSLLVLAACTTPPTPPPPAATGSATPEILTLSTNTAKLSENDHLDVTAIVTDDDGLDDLIGGALDDLDTGASYGAFATSSTEGTYALALTWSAIDHVNTIDAPIGGAHREFRARFFDQGGHVAEQTITVMLQCSQSGYALCDGQCTDIAADPMNCGACGVTIPDDRQCAGGMASCVTGAENTVAACSDGCSNDGDAYIDCNDYDCCDVVACAKGTTCNP